MKKPVLVACECTQIVTTAFRERGAVAFSCDIDKCYGDHPEWHIKCDVTSIIHEDWGLVVAHPPCTYLCRVGSQHLHSGKHTIEQVEDARRFFMMFTQLNCPTCVENPIPHRYAQLPPPTQWVCPSMFGHPYSKKTGLWLFGLPFLLPTCGYYANPQQWLRHSDHGMRARSRFFSGIAAAMAEQWYDYILEC